MKLTEIQNRNIVITALSLVLLLVIFLKMDGCNGIDRVATINTTVQDSLKIELNKLGQVIASQKEIIIQDSKEFQKQLLENSNLSKINSHLKAMFKTSIKNVVAKYESEEYNLALSDSMTEAPKAMVVLESNVDTTFNPLGRKFSIHEQWYSISGKITREGVLLSNIDIIDSLTVNYGVKRTGFLKLKKESYVELIHSNPDVNTLGSMNITLKNEKKWYQNKITMFVAGILVGGATTIYLIK